jgi:hypothetical protein
MLSETIAIGRVFWSTVSGVWKFWLSLKRRLSPQETLKLRAQWKPQFTEWLELHDHKKLRTDVIIRDIKSIDSYPTTTETKGSSAWFRSGVIDTYEKGMMLGLGTYELVYDKQKDVYYFPPNGKRGNTKLMFTGFVLFENIESVDWDGDQHCSYPHIYCYFDSKDKQRYERLSFCERRTLDEHTYFREIVPLEEVRRETKRRGIKSSFLG